MAQTTLRVRMKRFDGICCDFGITAFAEFNIFVVTAFRERRIPTKTAVRN